jgi:hypothetical protein
MSNRLALLLLVLWVSGCSPPSEVGPVSDVAGATPPAEGNRPSAKTREAVEKLKADLAAFEVSIHTWSLQKPGGEQDGIRLVTDPKDPAKAKREFLISEKQAARLIDYLADDGLFDRVYVPPPGILPPGWYVSVSGGKLAPGQKVAWRYQWAHGLDVKPGSVGIIKYLTRTLDGDAKSAIEGFRKGAEEPRR